MKYLPEWNKVKDKYDIIGVVLELLVIANFVWMTKANIHWVASKEKLPEVPFTISFDTTKRIPFKVSRIRVMANGKEAGSVGIDSVLHVTDSLGFIMAAVHQQLKYYPKIKQND